MNKIDQNFFKKFTNYSKLWGGGGWKVNRLKIYNDFISAVDDFYDKWDPRTTTSIKEKCEPQEGRCWKINLIESYSLRIFWSAHLRKYGIYYVWLIQWVLTNIRISF